MEFFNIWQFCKLWKKAARLEVNWQKCVFALFPVEHSIIWEVIWEIKWEIIDMKELLKREKKNPEIMMFAFFMWRKKFFIWNEWILTQVRHSCSPNCKLELHEKENGETVIRVVSKKEIWEFEEITVDFWKRFWWLDWEDTEFICDCWTRDCRWVKNYYWDSELLPWVVAFNWIVKTFDDIKEWERIWVIWWREETLKEINKRDKIDSEAKSKWFKAFSKTYYSAYKTNTLNNAKLVSDKTYNAIAKSAKWVLEVFAAEDIKAWSEILLYNTSNLID